MEKQTCKSCGAVLEENTVHCSECGLSTMIEEDVMKEILEHQKKFNNVRHETNKR